MKNLLSVLLIGLFALSTNAQQNGSIAGKVIINDGTPVEEAIVSLTSVSDLKVTRQTRVDDAGNFQFPAIPPGEYILKATGLVHTLSHVGELRVIVVSGQQESINIVIKPGYLHESVTVSAGLLQPIDEVSKSVSVITGQEMRERADFTLVDSLRTIPGFRVQQLGGFGRLANIKTRGLRNQDTAILIDGFRVRDSTAITGDASPFLADMTLTSIDRIEVLRGSGSSIYGTNSIGGTVNFITPEPKPGPSGQISYAVGGLGLHRVRGNFTDATESGKFGYNIAAARTVYTKGIDGNDDARNTNVQSRITVKPTSKTNISGRIFFTDAFVKLNTDPDTFGTMPPTNAAIINAQQGVNFTYDADDPDRTQKSRQFNGQIAVSYSVRNDVTVNAAYSGLKTRRTNDNGPLGAGFQSASTSIFDGSIQTANGSLLWSPENHQFRVGYEFERERYGNDGRTPSGTADFFTRAGQSSHTIFAQDVFSALENRLQIAGGFRAQFFDLHAPAFSLINAPYSNLSLSDPPSAITFDGAVSYLFRSTGTKLRAHVGNGYRVPSLYERYGSFFNTFPSNAFVALGDPSLKPEKTIAYDGGIDQSAFADKLRLSAVYFYTKLTDTIGYGNVVPDIGSTTRPFGGYINEEGGIARGGEFSATVRPSNSTDIFASYTHTKSLQRKPQVSGTTFLTTLGIPENQFTLVATQRFGKAWATFDLLATSSYLAPIFSNSTFSTYVYRFGGNRRGDLTGGYTFSLDKKGKSLRVFGTIENLFDAEYYENGFRTSGITGRIGVSFGF